MYTCLADAISGGCYRAVDHLAPALRAIVLTACTQQACVFADPALSDAPFRLKILGCRGIAT